jgi:hypothetical protein
VYLIEFCFFGFIVGRSECWRGLRRSGYGEGKLPWTMRNEGSERGRRSIEFERE